MHDGVRSAVLGVGYDAVCLVCHLRERNVELTDRNGHVPIRIINRHGVGFLTAIRFVPNYFVARRLLLAENAVAAA